MSEQHYALREFVQLKEKSEMLSLYILVDGIQYDRFFNEPLKENKGVRSLFSLPEDKALSFSGPWLLDISTLSQEYLIRIIRLENKYPGISWIISEQPFLILARHLESSLMVSLPSKEKGLFRFYDCRVLKMLPELLSASQIAGLMKYMLRWLFVSGDETITYTIDSESISVSTSGNQNINEGRS